MEMYSVKHTTENPVKTTTERLLYPAENRSTSLKYMSALDIFKLLSTFKRFNLGIEGKEPQDGVLAFTVYGYDNEIPAKRFDEYEITLKAWDVKEIE